IAVVSFSADHVDRAQHSSRMIPVSMRKDDAFYDPEIQSEPVSISLERIGLRPGVEQDRMAGVSAIRSNQAGKPVTGTTDAPSRKNAHPFPVQIGKFCFNIGRDSRQTVGRVIDQDLHLQSIHRLQTFHEASKFLACRQSLIVFRYFTASPM